jgi:hypothetical protein
MRGLLNLLEMLLKLLNNKLFKYLLNAFNVLNSSQTKHFEAFNAKNNINFFKKKFTFCFFKFKVRIGHMLNLTFNREFVK